MFFVLIGLSGFKSAIIRAQSSELSNKYSLFEDDKPLKLELISDFTQLIKEKQDEAYYDSECIIHWSESDSLKKSIKIKARGFFRKMNCYFPPLMLNFKPDSLITEDGHYGKIKLVTHCQKSKVYKEYILKEYLIYKLYEILSPQSLKTRLVEVSYWDTGKRERHDNNIGFLIEPVDALCKRTDGLEIKTSYFGDSEINPFEADRVALFMYMIGNTDWRIKSGHNIKFIKPLTHKVLQVTPVPYDFDHSGFINTSYANPSEWSIAETVTERDFLGRCRISDATYDKLIPEFLASEQQIYQTIMKFKWLEHKSRKRLVKYIESFFDELRNAERFKRHLHNSCMEKY